MGRASLPPLKNPALEALYRRIRKLEESLTGVGVAAPAGRPGGDAPQGSVQRTLAMGSAREGDCSTSSQPTSALADRPEKPRGAVVGT